MKVKITDLVPSQFSTGIYSPNPPEDLIESIRINGVLARIWISPDNTIISGHRRVEACKRLGIAEVEAEVREYSDSLVIESNRYRDKTWEERLKEAAALEKIEKTEAEKREKAGKKLDPAQNFAQGETREKVAARIGTSHETLRKVKVIAAEKPELLPSGGKTEIHKIREGLVDYILYVFVNNDEEDIIQYFIGDLKIFRENEPQPVNTYWNDPPDSEMAVYNLVDMQYGFVVETYPEDFHILKQKRLF
jgi:hypothetical protein